MIARLNSSDAIADFLHYAGSLMTKDGWRGRKG
jgi:hypothetical protein